MGRKTWRLQEELFLDGLVNSDQGRQRFARAIREDNERWWKNTVDWLVIQYKKEFNYCFDQETTEEFAARQKRQPRANLVPFAAETEQDLQKRMEKVTKVSSGMYSCNTVLNFWEADWDLCREAQPQATARCSQVQVQAR